MFEKGFLQDVRHNLWDVQIAGMIFQTRSKAERKCQMKAKHHTNFSAGQGVFLFPERMESASGSGYIRFDL